MNQKKRTLKRILIILTILLVLVVGFIIYYLTSYSKSLVTFEDFNNLDPNIKIMETDSGILLDTPSDDNMIVFYPGAKIENSAYLLLLYRLAQNNIDSFIVRFPFNLAIFDQNAFNKVHENYKVDHWYIMGHSLGGAMAANFIAKEKPEINGIILLAAYPTKDLKQLNIPLLSIYGDQDGVLNLDKYNENRQNWSENSEEVIIEGGNHSGFANYGEQKGDNRSSITSDEQQEQTVNIILEFIYRTQIKN